MEVKRTPEGKSKPKKKIRLPYAFLGKTILGVVAVAGIISVALVVPNAIQIIRLFEKQSRNNYLRHRSPLRLRHEVEKLRRQKKIVVFARGNEHIIRLTEKGRQELLRYQLKNKILEKRRWDKKWRIIIFDIQEKKRTARDRLRQAMQSFGFQKLQASVWVYPYECEQIVTLLKAECKLGKELLYIVAGEIENDAWLKKKFRLRS